MSLAQTEEAAPGPRDRLNFIAGEFVAGSGEPFENRSPVDGRLLGVVAHAGEDDVERAVSAARDALSGDWAGLTIDQRVEILHNIADGITARFDAFLDAEVADTGKPRSLASHIDIPRGAANFRIFADVIKNAGSEFFTMATPDGSGAINYALRSPKGVIGVICPWNLPLLLMTWKVGPALAAGNTVVVKPSEETPSTATLLGEVMNAAGVPKGVYNVVHGFGPGSTGEFLTRHPGIDAITFTGETVTGEAIMREAARGVRDISFELGGKNAALVFADCDMDKAVEGTLRSAFANCGQVCLGTERLYVERPVFDEFTARLKAGAQALKLGAPEHADTGMGPLISAVHRDKVLGYYERAAREGARTVTGGGVPEMAPPLNGGFWVEPTIWTGLPETSPVIREEIFGPCCHIAPFDTEDEAVALANDTDYGLAGVVWTENLTRAHRVAPKLRAGIIWINCWFLRDLRTPFGGMGKSGIGREGGLHSLEFYTETSNVCVKL